MLHVYPGTVARQLRRLTRAGARGRAVRDEAGHTIVVLRSGRPVLAVCGGRCGTLLPTRVHHQFDFIGFCH